MRIDQLAINSVSTRHADLAECLSAYRTAGFANVEFHLKLIHDHLAGGRDIRDVRRLLAGQQLNCIGGFDGVVECFCAGEQRQRNRQRLLDNARLLAELGATAMVAGTDGPSGDSQPEDPLVEIVAAYAEAADLIAPTGVTLCLEFNWSPIVKSFRTAAEVARRTGADNVGVLFDTAHYHCTPTKFEQLTAANVATVRHVHLNDMRDKPGELSHCNADRVLPGQGCLDLAALLGRLAAHGYDGYYSIELFNEELWSLPAGEAAARMYDSLLPLCE